MDDPETIATQLTSFHLRIEELALDVGLCAELTSNRSQCKLINYNVRETVVTLLDLLDLLKAFTKVVPFVKKFLQNSELLQEFTQLMENGLIDVNQGVLEPSEINDENIFPNITQLPALSKPFNNNDSLTSDNILHYCHLRFATVIMHCSLVPESLLLIESPSILHCLHLWQESTDLRLQLIGKKIHGNHRLLSQRQSLPDWNLATHPTGLFGPDLYQLDNREVDADEPLLDVIFVNGINGTVFSTWAQGIGAGLLSGTNDPCWPRAWLSQKFPQARIIGVDAHLKLFRLNEICPVDRLSRRIDQRANIILQQLLMVGVGKRPIAWITHSAGGILTKEILQLSTALSEKLQATENLIEQDRLFEEFFGNFEVCQSSSLLAYSKSGEQLGQIALRLINETRMSHPREIERATQLIVFISVPHHGCQLIGYMPWLDRILLTPESQQLELNSPFLQQSDAWFREWSVNNGKEVFTFVETSPLRILSWLSTAIVPTEETSAAYSTVIEIDADHSSICKPNSRDSKFYKEIVKILENML